MAPAALGVTFATLIGVSQAAYIHSFAGPYTVYSKRYWLCDKSCDGRWDWQGRPSHFDPYRPNVPQRITGWLHITDDTPGLSDALSARVVLDSRSNNEWKPNAFVFTLRRACSSLLQHLPNLYRLVFGWPASRKCPVPPGNYSVHNKTFDVVLPHVPLMVYGLYRARLSVFPALGRPAVCFCSELVVFPKL